MDGVLKMNHKALLGIFLVFLVLVSASGFADHSSWVVSVNGESKSIRTSSNSYFLSRNLAIDDSDTLAVTLECVANGKMESIKILGIGASGASKHKGNSSYNLWNDKSYFYIQWTNKLTAHGLVNPGNAYAFYRKKDRHFKVDEYDYIRGDRTGFYVPGLSVNNAVIGISFEADTDWDEVLNIGKGSQFLNGFDAELRDLCNKKRLGEDCTADTDCISLICEEGKCASKRSSEKASSAAAATAEGAGKAIAVTGLYLTVDKETATAGLSPETCKTKGAEECVYLTIGKKIDYEKHKDWYVTVEINVGTKGFLTFTIDGKSDGDGRVDAGEVVVSRGNKFIKVKELMEGKNSIEVKAALTHSEGEKVTKAEEKWYKKGVSTGTSGSSGRSGGGQIGGTRPVAATDGTYNVVIKSTTSGKYYDVSKIVKQAIDEGELDGTGRKFTESEFNAKLNRNEGDKAVILREIGKHEGTIKGTLDMLGATNSAGDLIKGVIMTESKFGKNSTETTGAAPSCGIMQVAAPLFGNPNDPIYIPGTENCVGKVGREGCTCWSSWNKIPENMVGGIKILNFYLRKAHEMDGCSKYRQHKIAGLHGTTLGEVLGAASYNWGRGDIVRCSLEGRTITVEVDQDYPEYRYPTYVIAYKLIASGKKVTKTEGMKGDAGEDEGTGEEETPKVKEPVKCDNVLDCLAKNDRKLARDVLREQLKEIGEACSEGIECESESCVTLREGRKYCGSDMFLSTRAESAGKECIRSSECAELACVKDDGEVVNYMGQVGKCRAHLGIGKMCYHFDDCAMGLTCANNEGAVTLERGTCSNPLEVNAKCIRKADCRSDKCEEGVCVAVAEEVAPAPDSDIVEGLRCPTDEKPALVLGDSITAWTNSYADRLKRLCDCERCFEKEAKKSRTLGVMHEMLVTKLAENPTKYSQLIFLGGVNRMDFSDEHKITKYREIIDTAASEPYGLTVIALTLTPWRYSTWTAEYGARTERMKDWLLEEPGKNTDLLMTVNIYDPLADNQSPPSLKTEYRRNEEDQLHPNPTGQGEIARVIYEQVYSSG